MKCLAFGMLKGGTGKSTIGFNIIVTRAMLNPNERYLMIDTDMQGNLTNLFKIESYEKVGADVSEMILGDKSPEEVVIKSPLDYVTNIDLIPSSFNLFRNEIRLNNSNAKEYKLDRIIRKYKDFFEKYDYIIFDTNPSLNIYNLNVFYVADDIINIAKNNCVSSIKALQMQAGIWGSMKVELDKEKEENIHVIVNMREERTVCSKNFAELIHNEEDLKDIVLKNKIRDSVIFTNATLENKPVYLYNRKHKAAEDVVNVIKELEERGVFSEK